MTVSNDLCNVFSAYKCFYLSLGLASSEFIQHSGLAVDFNFGYNVTVPGNNFILSDEQDFTIGLQTTVLNVPELVEGTILKYTAFVQTDFGKKTSTRTDKITVCW